VYTPPEDSAEDQAAKQQIAGEAERKRRWTAMALWGRLLDDWEDEGHVLDERYEAVRADVEAALGRTLLSIRDRDEFCRLMAALGEV
jgi:hypothetical protein